MPLNIPAGFYNDIQGRDTALVPAITIDTGIDDDPLLYISTNNFTFADIMGSPAHFKPLLLNIPSLKESIDISTRRYKISSVNLDISNFPYEGKRFSELITDSSMINKICRIFWISPSVDDIAFYDLGYSGDNMAFQVYFGTIRKYDMTDDKVRLVVEDRSQATLHKDLPLANLGDGDEVPDKYKNKPIPMVYGEVDRSPCVIGEQLESGEVKIFTDDPSSSSTIHTDSNPLSIFRDDKYLEVLSDYGDISHWGYSDGLQYTATNNIFLIATPYIQDVDNLDVKNPLGENMCAVKLIDSNYIYKLYTHLDNYSPTDLDKEYAFKAFFVNDLPEIYRTNVGGGDTTTFYEYRIQLIFERLNKVDENYHQDSTEAHITYLINYDWNADAWNYEDAKYIDVRLQPEGDGTGIIIADTEGLASTTSEGVSQLPASNISYNHNIGWVNESVAEQALYSQTMRVFPSLTASSAYSNIIINEFTRIAYFLIDKFRSQDFYANVNGRDIVVNAANSVTSNPRTATMQIWDIVRNELGYLQDWDMAINDAAHVEMHTNNYWTDFTVNKKINSKKLIEGLASATRLIPRFDNMGNFKFSYIPLNGQPPSGINIQRIKENDVIDFSFSRTSINDVYTKIEFKYNWDYAREEFNNSIVADITIVGIAPNYSFDYYGFAVPESDGTHPDSTLVIDDDRGKYIRNENTASDFAHWYLLWSCNQHLKMKIKLPLKYMTLEIGDFVDFDAILGGVKPYGIDYISNAKKVNDQQVFKNFLITDTNKGLEFVEISCIQMHNLDFSCTFDCANICNGTTIIDECGICGGDSSSCAGCDGVPNSGYWQDGCGDCVEPNNTDCELDCAGNYGHTSDEEFLLYDQCNVCGGAATVAGTGDMDDCGICDGNNEDKDACWQEIGDPCTGSDCTPCEGCKEFAGINYNDNACRDTQNNCIFPINYNLTDLAGMYCPISEMEEWGLPHENWICNLIPVRCNGEESGVFNISSYAGNTDAMNEAIHAYCIGNADCDSAYQGILESQYPLVLSQTDCDIPVNELVALKAELVFYDEAAPTPIEIHKYEIWNKDGIGNELNYELLCPNSNPCGSPSFWERATSAMIRITYNTNAVYNVDQEIVSTINGLINLQTGGGEFTNNCTVENEDWWDAFEVNSNPYEATLKPSNQETVIEHKLVIDEWFGGDTGGFMAYYCGVGDSYRVYKFMINLQSAVEVVNNGGYVTVETGDVYINLIEGTQQLIGDTDCDGDIDVNDVSFLNGCITSDSCDEEPCYGNMDLNGDGALNGQDITELANCWAAGTCG